MEVFIIRHARCEDALDLLAIEKTCWGELQLPKDDLLFRISAYPEGQFVAVIDNIVVGVIYSQRIQSHALLQDDTTTFKTQHKLHHNHNSVLQLLGVAVLPQFAHLQIGEALKLNIINFARSVKINPVKEVVAMTRCCTATNTIEEYLERVSTGNDPILQFHMKAGARVIQPVAKYRPDDTVNWGYAVLITYGDIHRSGAALPPLSDPSSTNFTSISGHHSFSAESHSASRNNDQPAFISVCAELRPITTTDLSDLIATITEQFRLSSDPPDSALPAVPMSKQFMSLGFDSLTMVELINRLQMLIDRNFDAMAAHLREICADVVLSAGQTQTVSNYCSYKLATTILFNYPTPTLMLKFLNKSVSNRHVEFHRELSGLETDTPPLTPTREVLHRKQHSGDVSLLKQATTSVHKDFPVLVDKGSSSVLESQEHLMAIVGMSCRFPTGAQADVANGDDPNTPEGFYSALCAGLDTVQTVPSEWNCSTRFASFLHSDVAETFDYAHYGLTYAESLAMDPHQRLLLDLAHEALVQANVSLQPVQSEGNDEDRDAPRVGVFVGLSNNEWMHVTAQQSSTQDITPYTSTGTAQSSAANRISYLLGLSGPSMVVDSACSSSLVALHTAINSIRCGDCDVAVVAAADLLISSYSLRIREVAGMLSPDGCNRSFDAGANGYVRGEGGGCVVIKRLADAEADGSARILGVIRGSAVNQDARSVSFTAPSGSAQRRLIQSALRNARVSPNELCFLETHGTGTALGDPIEWGAIQESLLQSDSPDVQSQPLVIGAVKSNIGHLEGAAGMAGLIKTVLILQNGVAPGNLHMCELNPQIVSANKNSSGTSERNVVFPHKPTPLTGVDGVLVAGVSSFGSGGTNAHVIVQNYVSKPRSGVAAKQSLLLPATEQTKEVAFLFTGQGSAYEHMGRELFKSQAVFRAVIEQCSNALPSLTPSLVDVMYGSSNESGLLLTTEYSQLAIVAVEIALAALWKANNVLPSAMAGHSLGEYAVAVVAGVLSVEHAMVLVHARIQCITRLTQPAVGAMVSIKCSEAEARLALNTFIAASSGEDSVVQVAAVNSPNTVVLSGHRSALESLLGGSTLKDKTRRFLPMNFAYHSQLLAPAAEAFRGEFQSLLDSGKVVFNALSESKVDLISCRSGKKIQLSELCSVDYWVQQMLNTVQFSSCLSELLGSAEKKHSLFVEIGPSNVLSAFVPQCVIRSSSAFTGNELHCIASLSKDNQAQFQESVTSLNKLLNCGAKGGRLSLNYNRNCSLKWRQLSDSSPVSRPVASSGSSAEQSLQINEESLTRIVEAAVLTVLPGIAFDGDSTVNKYVSLLSLGVDSLGSLAIRNILQSKLGPLMNRGDGDNEDQSSPVTLITTLVLKHPTINSIVTYLLTEIFAISNAVTITTSAGNKNSHRHRHVSFDKGRDRLFSDVGIQYDFPATNMQQAMLYHTAMDAALHSFIETFTWEVRSGTAGCQGLNVEAFYMAWIDAAKTHDCLRSSFDLTAVPVPRQRVWNSSSVHQLNLPMSESDWFRVVSVEPEEDVAEALARERAVQRSRDFDLTVPSLFYVTIVDAPGSNQQFVLFTTHHVLVDGVSMQILLSTLSRFYSQRCIKLRKGDTSDVEIVLAPSYKLFAHFEAKELQLVTLQDSNDPLPVTLYYSHLLDGWNTPNKFSNMPALTVNASDEEVCRVVQVVSLPFNGSYESMVNIARDCNITLASLFQAVWCLTYSCFVDPISATDGAQSECFDLLYGNTTSGRNASSEFLSSVDNIVGPVINTIPLRVALTPSDDFVALAQKIHAQLVDAMEFENYPLAEIQKLGGRGKLFDLIFDFQTTKWDFALADGEASTESDAVRFINSTLADRIGCPLSVRVLVDNARGGENKAIELHATSECREYSEPFLALLLDTFQAVLGEVVMSSGRSVGQLLAPAKAQLYTALEVTGHLNRLEYCNPVLPVVNAISSALSCTVDVHAGQLAATAAHIGVNSETVLSLLFLLSVHPFTNNPSETFVAVEFHTHSAEAGLKNNKLLALVNTNKSFAELCFTMHQFNATFREKCSTVNKANQAFVADVLFRTVSSTIDHSASLIGDNVLIANVVNLLPRADSVSSVLHFPTTSVPQAVMEGICKGYQNLVKSLVSEMNTDILSQPISQYLKEPRPVQSLTPDTATISDNLMHEAFVVNATEHGDAAAVVCFTDNGDKVDLSYSVLSRVSLLIAEKLLAEVSQFKRRCAADASCVVAVVMEKGWEQVAAVLAVHRLQCVYLPMDARLWPEHRIRQVLQLSEAVAVLTQSHLLQADSSSWMNQLELPVVLVDKLLEIATSASVADPSYKSIELGLSELPKKLSTDLAYLIYTSGSTGVPKGVCCHHRGAVNTIDDLNELFSVSRADRVLALSSLSFDLSVYDIFGLLSAGGTVVIPQPSSVSPPDPGEWLEMLCAEQVTVWNTVPAFMELLVSHAEFSGSKLPACLRLVFMSGDWIPVSLPARIRAASENADIRIISMGGATEASIWSNMFELHADDSAEDLNARSGIPSGWNSIPYGRPMRNQRMYVLNERMENCEVWVTGAIFIGGVGVASGYYRNAERTAAQFVRHPVTGEALFRTGDLGRVRPEGLIEILGREDSQVKVNGFRIELGEIERVLTQHTAVVSAALAVHNNSLCAYLVLKKSDDSTNDSEVYAELQAVCKVQLADYMVPHHFMAIDEIPLSSNGKVMREKLPKPASNSSDGVAEISADCCVVEWTERETVFLGIWAAVLNIPSSSITKTTNFFSIGGDSLRSLQVVAQARKHALLISVPQIFNHPTIENLAAVASGTLQSGPEILGTSSEGGVGEKPIFTIDKSPEGEDEYPLIGINQAHFVGLHTSSYAQNGMTPQIYFEWAIGSDDPRHAAAGGMSSQQVDIAKLEHCFDLFIQRHLTFRSVVTSSGRMKLLTTVPPFIVEHIHPFTGDHVAAKANAAAFRAHMMDNGPTVDVWPLFEVRVTHTSATSSLVHITVSLFLMDAMSDLILRQELSALYRAAISGDVTDIVSCLPAPSTIAFSDYCTALDKKLVLSDEHKRAKEYWLGRLDTLSGSTELPILPRNALTSNAELTGRFVNYHRWLTAFEWRRAKKNCAKHLVTMPAVLLAAYSLVLYRFGNCDSFLVNILQCLRHQVHEDVNKMVGNCSSTILCDIDFRARPNEPLTFKSAVVRIAQELSRNLEHASMSGVEVMQELNRKHGKTFKAVAPFIFTTPIGVEKGNKQVVSRDWVFQEEFFSERVPHTACVNAIKADPNGTACASLDIIDGVFPPEVMQGMYETYTRVLDVICASDGEAWNQPISQYLIEPRPVQSLTPDTATISDSLMHEAFVANATEHGDAAAIVAYSSSAGKLSLSYDRLSAVSLAVAAELLDVVVQHKEAHVRSSTVVAVVMEKGWEQVAAVLAVHCLQCVYLPMDARLWPEHRIRQVLQLSEAVAVLTQSHIMTSEAHSWLSELSMLVVCVDSFLGLSVEQDAIAAKLDESIAKNKNTDLAYLIYTSGSTGVPKGVCCHHRGAVNTIDDLNELFSVGRADRVLALSSLSFDLSVYDIFGLLSAGGTVVIPQPSSVSPPDPGEWLEMLCAEQVTVWNTVPAFMELLVSHAEFSGAKLPACLRLVFMSGDWIPVSLPARIRAASENADIRIISMGGATEASIWSNMFELHADDSATDLNARSGIPSGWSSIPYGRPMRNQRMYVLNERMENCEVWVTGAIFIGGVGVASGYYRNAERTAAQFVRHPVTGEALFRTGDLGRVRPEGLIEILGREDSQVKVNGFRIELGEIERVLTQHTAVVSAALAVHNNLLCAYLVLRKPDPTDSDQQTLDADTVFETLRAICKVQLADYMVPHYFMAIDEIPLSSNGKVMREKLPSPLKQQQNSGDGAQSRPGRQAFTLPASEAETAVRDIFSQVLRIDVEAICCEHTTFFDLGGNSLSSIQLLFALRERFQHSVSVQELFAAPTVRAVHELLAKKAAASAASESGEKSAPGDNHAVTNNRMQLLELNKGTEGVTPIILVHPAGASGLCYFDLVSQLTKNRRQNPVYALDDGVMTSDKPFTFTSIEEVARECMPHVLSVAKARGFDSGSEILLGGWSYGGVIATEIAKQIAASPEGVGARVRAVVLFDSPLRAVETRNEEGEDSVETSAYQRAKRSNKSNILNTSSSTDSSSSGPSAELEERIEGHFNRCTDLLADYHQRPAETQPLSCPVLDVRPVESSYHCDVAVIQELTSVPVQRTIVPGSHWTMMFGDHVAKVAESFNDIL